MKTHRGALLNTQTLLSTKLKSKSFDIHQKLKSFKAFLIFIESRETSEFLERRAGFNLFWALG
jgi:hypothetical protein